MTLNSKTRVQFVYVLPEVLHGDFLSEIKYLFNLEGNILRILGRSSANFDRVKSVALWSAKKK